MRASPHLVPFVSRLGCVLLASALVSAGGESPNVLLLLSDQHRWHAMGNSAMPELATPALDRLAAEGVAVTNAISSYPVCAPMRAMLLTGRWPWQTRVIDNPKRLKSSENTLGKVFRSAGYDTGYIGKWHVSNTHGAAYGFDHSIVWRHTAEHWNSDFRTEETAAQGYDGYNAVGMADQAIDFLKQERSRPFFLIVSFDPPHPRLDDAPPAQRALYPEGKLSFRGNVPESWRTGAKYGWYQGYHAHVSALDEQIARVLGALEERGLAQETLVIYTSDHGTMLGSHGWQTQKRLPYDESVRVPLLLRWPGKLTQGRACETLVGTIDLFPTLCGLAGVPVPETCAGRDLSGFLLGKSAESEPESVLLMHIQLGREGSGSRPVPLYRGVRTQRYTYAVREEGPWLLFDDEADPLQLNNLVDDPDLEDVRRELAGALSAWLVQAEDPFALPKSAWE